MAMVGSEGLNLVEQAGKTNGVPRTRRSEGPSWLAILEPIPNVTLRILRVKAVFKYFIAIYKKPPLSGRFFKAILMV